MVLKIFNYQQAEIVWKTVRSKPAGKPMGHGKRMHRDPDGTFRMERYDKPFATLSPQNILTVLAIVPSMDKFIPVMHVGVGGRRPGRIAHELIAGRCGWDWTRTNGQEFFSGVQFDALTGEVLNAVPLLKNRKIPEVDTQWRSCLSKFRTLVKAMDCMGVMVDLKPKWLIWGETSAATDLVVAAIRGGKVDLDVLETINGLHSRHYYVKDEGYTWTTHVFDRFIDNYRTELRMRFGVYADK